MNKTKTKTKPRRWEQRFHTWHRYVGITIAVFVIYLSVTGILLNHSDSLELDKKMVSTPSLLQVYGIRNPSALKGYAVNKNWISAWNNQVFLNDQPVTHSDYPLQGAVAAPGFIVVATLEEILLVTQDGQLVERLTAPSEKLGDIKRVGVNANNLITVETGRGQFSADSDLIAWQPGGDQDIQWAVPATLPKKVFRNIVSSSHSIHWERVLLDMHSGRVAGDIGVLVIDLVAIALILLALSGLYMWNVRRQRLKSRH